MPFLNLLVTQLLDTFPDCRVYDKPVTTGLRPPCFIIAKPRKHHKRLLNHNLELTAHYIVTYIPEDNANSLMDIYDKEAIILSDPRWKYLGGKMHLYDLETEPKGEEKFMLIKFNVKSQFKYVLPVVEPMEGVWVGTTIYDPIDNPGVDPSDPENPTNPGDPVDPENPNDPDDMGHIIIN